MGIVGTQTRSPWISVPSPTASTACSPLSFLVSKISLTTGAELLAGLKRRANHRRQNWARPPKTVRHSAFLLTRWQIFLACQIEARTVAIIDHAHFVHVGFSPGSENPTSDAGRQSDDFDLGASGTEGESVP